MVWRADTASARLIGLCTCSARRGVTRLGILACSLSWRLVDDKDRREGVGAGAEDDSKERRRGLYGDHEQGGVPTLENTDRSATTRTSSATSGPV